MADQQDAATALTINGRFLQHYLRTLELMQETFDKEGNEGLPAFNKFVYYLRSIINDKDRVTAIDQEMVRERERVFSREFAEQNPEMTDEEKEYLIGFKVVNGCMKYLANTLNLNKVQSRDMSDVNGLMLNHVLTTMEKMQRTFAKHEKDGLKAFLKHVYYLLSIITDAKRVQEIEKDMELKRQQYQNADPIDREFIVGFSVISGCMAYVDHTMKINKRQVKVLACHLDPNLPAPSEKPIMEDEFDNQCPRVFTSE